MELITLSPFTFQPQRIVENYSSLIWTERYATNGDFQLVSNNVAEAAAALPLPKNPLGDPLDPVNQETFVSLRDSTVPMVVETHKIEKPKGEAARITITGRSFETVLERRASIKDSVVAGDVHTAWTLPSTSPSDAAYEVIRTIIGDPIARLTLPPVTPYVTQDAIPVVDLTLPLDYAFNWVSTQTYIPGNKVINGGFVWESLTTNTNVTPAVGNVNWSQFGPATPLTQFDIPVGDLYSTAMNLINQNHHGLKSVRSITGGSQIGVEIYNGIDRRNLVVFDARFDQIDSSTYLLSYQGSANVAYVLDTAGGIVQKTTTNPTGLARRVLAVDQTGAATSTSTRQARGLVELSKFNATALFDGEVSQQVGSGYNSKYFLGDILQLHGEYGLVEDVRVAEFIRTSDNTGDKAYPTFEVIST